MEDLEVSVEEERSPTDVSEEALASPTAVISSLLFVSTRPITFERLVELSGLPEDVVEQVLEEVKQLFQDEVHGFSLHEVSSGFQLRTSPQVGPVLKRTIPTRTKRLSKAAGETLAVIAYKQPVERAEIEAIRGVDALPTLKTLLDAKLIRVIGKHDSPGHPVLYGTTVEFLERFGLSDLSALPTLHDFEQLAAEPGEGLTEIESAQDGDAAEQEEAAAGAERLDYRSEASSGGDPIDGPSSAA